MGIAAVVFDLFGTLVDNHSHVGHPSEEWRQMQTAMAAVLSTDADRFIQAWDETWRLRATGAFPTLDACIGGLCRSLAVEPPIAAIEAAAALRLEYVRGSAWNADAVAPCRRPKRGGSRTMTTLVNPEHARRFEEGLRSGNPMSGLTRVIQHLLSQAGARPATLLAELESFRETLQAQGRETDEDVVLEVMDFLSGWCSPHMDLSEGIDMPNDAGAGTRNPPDGQ